MDNFRIFTTLALLLIYSTLIGVSAQVWEANAARGPAITHVTIDWEDLVGSRSTIRPVPVSDDVVLFAFCSLSAENRSFWYVIKSCNSGQGAKLQYTAYQAPGCTGTASPTNYNACSSEAYGTIDPVFYHFSISS
jgi:hypothetical protein